MATIKKTLEFNSLEEFKNIVQNIEINESDYIICELPKGCYYEQLILEHEKPTQFNAGDDGYCWSLKDNWHRTGSVHTTYPMKNTNYVKMFKTKGGAIRRLFKFLSWHENNGANKFII